MHPDYNSRHQHRYRPVTLVLCLGEFRQQRTLMPCIHLGCPSRQGRRRSQRLGAIGFDGSLMRDTFHMVGGSWGD
jgi:hypothetical protein